ncbi:MAG: helix-turn-helix transcriptional regulator [Lachnospiraceae bacterium]|nr:helix-turn-helix transcriptional regulator [Lachnospiraceae bacterium]
MSMEYKNVLERLREEREKKAWTQKDISQHICMGQAQYCKIEKGTQNFSYDEVKALTNLEIDVHYIFTGQRSKGCFAEKNEKVNYTKAISLLEMIFAVIKYYYTWEPSVYWEKLYQEIKFVRFLDADQDYNNNLFYMIRCIEHYTQKEMAGYLGVDVKKLRRLENGQCLPDSELLWRFYNEFRVPPSIIIKDKKGILCEAGWLLEKVDSKTGKNSLAMMNPHYVISE